MTNFFKKLKEECGNLLCGGKLFLVFLLIVFLLGLIIGIINVVNLRNYISCQNLLNKTMLCYLKHDISIFSFFFRRLLFVIIVYFCLILICFNKYTSFIFFLYVLYFSYALVFNMSVMIICFGFFGVIFSIVNILLLSLIQIFCYTWLVLCLQKFSGKCYFQNLSCGYQMPLTILIFLLISVLLESLLLPIFSFTFIVVF